MECRTDCSIGVAVVWTAVMSGSSGRWSHWFHWSLRSLRCVRSLGNNSDTVLVWVWLRETEKSFGGHWVHGLLLSQTIIKWSISDSSALCLHSIAANRALAVLDSIQTLLTNSLPSFLTQWRLKSEKRVKMRSEENISVEAIDESLKATEVWTLILKYLRLIYS